MCVCVCIYIYVYMCIYVCVLLTQQCFLFSVYSDMEAKFKEKDDREDQLVKAKEKLEKQYNLQ